MEWSPHSLHLLSAESLVPCLLHSTCTAASLKQKIFRTDSEYEDPQKGHSRSSQALTMYELISFLAQGACSSLIKGSSTASRYSTHPINNTLLWILQTISSTYSSSVLQTPNSTLFTMQFNTAAFLLLSAMGAVANPIESQPGSVDAGDKLVTGFIHTGVSDISRPVL